jgi:hypothetical protein
MPIVSVASETSPCAVLIRRVLRVIEIDLGKLGKARLHRPTPLEVWALVAFLAFAGLVWVFR